MSNTKIIYPIDRANPLHAMLLKAVRGERDTAKLHRHLLQAPCDGQIKVTEQGIELVLLGTVHSVHRWVQELKNITGHELPNRTTGVKHHPARESRITGHVHSTNGSTNGWRFRQAA